MKIQEVYETEDAIPEDLRESYEEQEDGTFKLELVAGLKTALSKERENVKTLKAELTTVTGERDALSTETHGAKEKANKAIREAAAAAALQKVGGNISLISDKVVAKLGVNESGDAFVTDDSGAPLLDADGNAMSVGALVSELRADPEFAGAFKGTGSAGGGTPPLDNLNSSTRKTEVPSRRGQMTPRQKVNYINEHGDEAYQSLPF